MKAKIDVHENTYSVDLEQHIDISTPLDPSQNTVRAFDAPPLAIDPVRAGEFVGSVREGAPINFMNIRINPHGNGTHTECIGHITEEKYTINQCLNTFWWLARLITVSPQSEGKDRQITADQLPSQLQENSIRAVVLRTTPNPRSKIQKNYSGTNPPYLTAEATQHLRQQGVQHLLVDLPSVDKEKDEGKLSAHKAFWNYPDQPQPQNTITELVYVPDRVKDGLYFLNLQIISLESDASPSKPILYPII